MQYFDITVPTTGAFPVHAPGRYIRYLSGNAGGNDTTIVVTPGGMGGTKITLKPGQAYRVAKDKPVPDSWTLQSYLGQGVISGQVVIGDGQIDDTSIAGTVQVVDGGKARSMNNSAYIGFANNSSAGANYAEVQLWNPSTNPNRLVVENVFEISMTGGGNAVLATSSTAVVGATVEPGQPKLLGGTVSQAVCAYGSTASAPPTNPTLFVMGMQASVSKSYQPKEPIVIPPGKGLTLTVNAANCTLAACFEWYEEPNV